VVAAILNTGLPEVIVLVVCLVLVPGSTVPKGTPKSLIWRRKLWELHAGLLGLGLAISAAFFITNGMKNMFGKPRPDMLARCQPDLENIAKYVVGGIGLDGFAGDGRLVSADICTSTNKKRLDDGFRSFPSGHSSSSSAGLIYLSLFLASKFAVTIPYVPQAWGPIDHDSHSAFPSRVARAGRSETSSMTNVDVEAANRSDKQWPQTEAREATMNKVVLAVRRQAAAPPVYLLVLAVFPFFLSVFIASTRWFDFRHHGFDIIFGYLIGVVTAVFSFRYYHLPISSGAGWAWAPRSADRAFWAGVGRYSYAMQNTKSASRGGNEEEAIGMVTVIQGDSTATEDQSLVQGRSNPTS
jgi:membrane-associated phospholipid phosphatase